MGPLVQPTGDPVDPYGWPSAAYRGFTTEQTAADIYKSSTSGAGGQNFRWAGPSRPVWVCWCNLPGPSGPIWVRWCNLLGPQQTHMGPLVQPTGTIADPYGSAGATYPDPSGPIWVRWCSIPGPQRTHMQVLSLPGQPPNSQLKAHATKMPKVIYIYIYIYIYI